MNNFMNDLEKFGLSGMDMSNLFEDEKDENIENAVEIVKIQKESTEVEKINEEDFLFDKTIECPVCGKKFHTRMVRTSKARRIGADEDLRPRYKGIDTIKYDVSSCPYCGYTAMNRFFSSISTVQAKLIRENVSSRFQPTVVTMPPVIDYDMAIDRYKLALFNAVTKKSQISERAYTCLKISWLCRGKIEEMLAEHETPDTPKVVLCKQEENSFYEQAYEGFMKAISAEPFPICGMDSATMEYLLAEMAFKLQKYDIASKLVGRLLVSNANRNIKDKALDLKQELIKALKSER